MICRDEVALLVIDFQEKLIPKIAVADAVMARAVKLTAFAREFDQPILWTEQYVKGLGPTVPAIADHLDGVIPLEKTSFGCCGDEAFCTALSATSRKQLLVTGIETHVCVMQTVLVALEQGYEAFVVRDAVASRAKSEYKAGLDRMVRAGAELVTTEMAMFEMLREAGTPEFRSVLPMLK
jgi:nicotinamidase-related amidase